MKTARPITNRYQDFRLLNLSQLVHRREGHGPFLVAQDGCDPRDPTMRECSFVLTKRGTWLHFYLYLALPESVRAHCAYWDAAADAMASWDSLPAEPIVEDAASLQELIHAAGFEPAANDLTGQALWRELRRTQLQEPSAPRDRDGA